MKTAQLERARYAPGLFDDNGQFCVYTERQRKQINTLRLFQRRYPDWVQFPSFARLDPRTTWRDDLRPAFGEQQSFFETEYERMRRETMEPQQ